MRTSATFLGIGAADLSAHPWPRKRERLRQAVRNIKRFPAKSTGA